MHVSAVMSDCPHCDFSHFTLNDTNPTLTWSVTMLALSSAYVLQLHCLLTDMTMIIYTFTLIYFHGERGCK